MLPLLLLPVEVCQFGPTFRNFPPCQECRMEVRFPVFKTTIQESCMRDGLSMCALTIFFTSYPLIALCLRTKWRSRTCKYVFKL